MYRFIFEDQKQKTQEICDLTFHGPILWQCSSPRTIKGCDFCSTNLPESLNPTSVQILCNQPSEFRSPLANLHGNCRGTRNGSIINALSNSPGCEGMPGIDKRTTSLCDEVQVALVQYGLTTTSITIPLTR